MNYCIASGQFAKRYEALKGKHYPDVVACPSCGKQVKLRPHMMKGADAQIPRHNRKESA